MGFPLFEHSYVDCDKKINALLTQFRDGRSFVQTRVPRGDTCAVRSPRVPVDQPETPRDLRLQRVGAPRALDRHEQILVLEAAAVFQIRPSIRINPKASE